MVEGECAALAAKSVKKGQLAAIEETLEQMQAQMQGERQPLDADRLFHLRIAEATNNGALVYVVKSLWEERGGPLFTKLQHHFDTPKSWAAAIREHAAVLEAIRGHDPDQARATMHQHMEQAAKRFSKSWDGR